MSDDPSGLATDVTDVGFTGLGVTVSAPVRLFDVLDRPQAFRGWLYLPYVQPWTAEVCGVFVDEYDRRSDEPHLFPPSGEERLWCETVDVAQIEDVVENARLQLERVPTLEERLAAFNYYIEQDAFMLFDNA